MRARQDDQGQRGKREGRRRRGGEGDRICHEERKVGEGVETRERQSISNLAKQVAMKRKRNGR